MTAVPDTSASGDVARQLAEIREGIRDVRTDMRDVRGEIRTELADRVPRALYVSEMDTVRRQIIDVTERVDRERDARIASQRTGLTTAIQIVGILCAIAALLVSIAVAIRH